MSGPKSKPADEETITIAGCVLILLRACYELQ